MTMYKKQMRKFLFFATVLVFGLTACSSDSPRVTDVTLYPSTLGLMIGYSATLTATVIPDNAANQNVTWLSTRPTIATVTNGVVTAVAEGTATITVKTADGNRTETAKVEVFGTTDAGVEINGIRWATRNLALPGTFAPYPHSTGRFYQWGTLNGVTHHWASTGREVIGWDANKNRIAWTTANDPCPTGWRVPTVAEFTILRDAGFSEWTQLNGVNGRFFGTAPNQIFLPAAGWRVAGLGLLDSVGVSGNYWSSSTEGSGERYARAFYLSQHPDHVVTMLWTWFISGLSVRCVAE